MTRQHLLEQFPGIDADNRPFTLTAGDGLEVRAYPRSLLQLEDQAFFVARVGREKYLLVAAAPEARLLADFEGREVEGALADGVLKQCPLTHANAEVVRRLFDFARPVLVGVQNSFGLGDRLGIANPAHLRAVAGSGMKPVLAQQSIRELERTERQPEDVLDAATWAVLQEGYRDGFGADADHLKTTEDIDRMVNAGFTMFTFDPGAHVVNEADTLPLREVEQRVRNLPWDVLQDQPEGFLTRYGKTFTLKDLTLQPTPEQVLRGLLKYGGVIAHAVEMHRYFKATYPNHAAEFELSVDETESVTSPFEHFLVANELQRLGVQLVSLAPRFVGEFEKGIDYKGDLERFREAYLQHVRIAETLGPYKISIHSGSDKFRVYRVIGALREGHVHVKTAGTSYLEALRTVAAVEPQLFREILDFARAHYEEEKRTYHVSAKLSRVPEARRCSDDDLLALFEQDDARQVLHVTYGRVLTEKSEEGTYRFRERLLSCLEAHEEAHYEHLYRHFRRHIEPFCH